MSAVRSVTAIAIAPGKGDRKRLVMMIAGVAVGVMLAALLLAGFLGLADRGARSTWNTYNGVALSAKHQWDQQTPLAEGEFAAAGMTQYFDAQSINVLYVYGADAPATQIPGIREGVAEGSSWVSPALQRLIDENPPDQLGDRFGTVTGTLPDRVLAGPDSLVAVVGVPLAQVNGSFSVVSNLEGYRYVSQTYEIIAVLGSIAVLIPVFMLLRIVTSLGSADRSERMRSMHLLGATASDRARFAFIEAAGVGLIGALGGVGLAWVAALAVAHVRVSGSTFFPDDLRPSWLTALVFCVVVPLVFGTIAAWGAARAGGQASTARDRAEKPLRWWRATPLVAGIALFAYMMLSRAYSVPLVVGSFIVIAGGLIVLGPLMTQMIASSARRATSSPAGLVAYGRIKRHPRLIFRAVSGVVIAVFLVSLFMSGITSVREGEVQEGKAYLSKDALVVSLNNSGLTLDQAKAVADAAQHQRGVTGFAAVYANEEGEAFASSADLASMGLDSAGENVSVSWNPLFDPIVIGGAPANVTPAWMSGFYVATDSAPSRERVRTAIAALVPTVGESMTRGEYAVLSTSEAREYRSLAVLGIFVAAGVSAVALAAATMSAVRDRRRTLALLRLTGMPFSVVRKIMMREAVVPLVAATLVSALVGYGTGWLMVSGLSENGRQVTLPPPEYYVVIALTIAMSIVAVTTAFPAAKRATSTESTRFE